jgi:hypothetical protein
MVLIHINLVSGLDGLHLNSPSSICKKLDITYASVKKDGSKLVSKIGKTAYFEVF